eukprot:COSAG01_NODE_62617_length_283_cov_2.494565_1_plen_23_part_10
MGSYSVRSAVLVLPVVYVLVIPA